MYLQHFGLKEYPFKITPDLEFFYHQDSRDFALQNLKFAIDRGEGIIKVTGEVGSGKTTILRLLAKSLPKNFKIIYLSSPNISSKDLLFFICSELDIQVDNNLNKQDILKLLQEALIELYSTGLHLIMLIDEIQVMPVDTLEELRLLSNLETEKDKLIQLVIFGQTEFDKTLRSQEAKPLLARISTSIYLNEFSTEEIKQYLNYRMRIAGYKGEDFFSMKESKKIFTLSDGLPRKINLLADKLLLSVFMDKRYKIKSSDFNSLDEKARTSFVKPLWFVMGLLLIVAGYFGFDWSHKYMNNTSASSPLFEKQLTEDKERVIRQLPSDSYTILVYSGSLLEFNQILSDKPVLKSFISLDKTFLRLSDDKKKIVVFYGFTKTESIAEQIYQQDDFLPLWPNAKVIKIRRLDDIIK